MRFKGRVIDGPWEGREYAHEIPRFQMHWREPESVCYFRPDAYVPSAVTMNIGTYVWSYSLKAWCWRG